VRQAGLKILFRRGIKTEADVRDAVDWLKEPKVGTHVNCRETEPSHCSPFRFLSDITLAAGKEWIAWANRAGSKSYLAALSVWLRSSTVPRLETTILGGSLEQSQKAYKAIDSFWAVSGMGEELLEKPPLRRSTVWKSGSQVAVLTASSRSVRGPHPQVLIMDEIDEMPQEIYDAALSQPTSKYGAASMLGRLSTNHHLGGVMDQALDRARAAGMPLYKWCVWECLAPCLDYRCSTCELAPYCPGEHMKKADGYYAVEDLLAKLRTMSYLTLEVEWFCRKVGSSDLVYGHQFGLDKHSGPWLPSFSDGLPAHLSIDWGGEVFSVGCWQQFDFGWVRVDEVYMRNTTNTRLMEECKTRPWWANVEDAVADPSRDDLIREWRAEHVRFLAADNRIDVGVGKTRDALAPVIGPPRFYVNRRCRDWLREVQSYKEKNGKPVKKNDHTQDETRYFIMAHIAGRGRGRIILPTALRKREEESPKPSAPMPVVAGAEKKEIGGNDGKESAVPRSRGRIFVP